MSADPTLLHTVLDATAIKPNAIKCNRCLGFDHKVGSCPFPRASKGSSKDPRGERIKDNKYVKISTEISDYMEKHALESTNVGSGKNFCSLANVAFQGTAMAKAKTLLNLKIF